MQEILNQIASYKIVPAVVIDNSENAIELAETLIKAGLPVVEVTFRTPAAKESIKKITSLLPDILTGAGTVLSVDQVKSAVDNGAGYIVAPGLNSKVVEYCIVNNIPVIPGIATPSEIERALEFNLEVVKFFPAEELGGIKYLKAVSAPYGDLKFIPTGGINQNNISEYLSFPKVVACGGSWMVKRDLISGKKFDEIKNLTEKVIDIVREI